MLIAVGLCLTGCVQRSLQLNSQPSGADVFVDNKYVGKTPVTVDFTYGGQQELIFIPPYPSPDGKSYHPLVMMYDSTRAEHDTPIVDVLAEFPLWGADDRQVVDATLKPSNWKALYDADPDAFRESIRVRAIALRDRMRELQALSTPTDTLPPGWTESGPTSRPESAPARNP